MSEVLTKREPMIDFDERHLPPQSFTEQKIGDLLAELLSVIRDKGEPHETGLESKTLLSAKARQEPAESGGWKHRDEQMACVDLAAIEAGLLGTRQPKAAPILPGAEASTVEHKRPNPPAPFIGGDFAAIEAGLMGALQEQGAATVTESGTSKAFPSVTAAPEGRLYQENQPAPRRARLAERQKRLRRSLHVVVAIAVAGMAGTTAIFGLNRRPPEPTGLDERHAQATGVTDVPAEVAPILSRVTEPSPRALNGNERTFEAPQVAEKALPADSQAQPINGPPAVPAVPAQAPMPAEPQSMAAPVESNTVKADLVPSDGALLPSGATQQANIDEARPAPQSPAEIKAPPVRTAAPVAHPQKPAAAKHRHHRGELRQISNKAKSTRRSSVPAEPVPSTSPEAQSTAMQPSPAADGVFGFLQNAVNSLAGTTAKLFGGSN